MPVTVLLVDDSAVIRGLMHKALSASPDINIIGSAANGSMAIPLAETLKPEIIILDIEMPVMDGITALPLLIKASPASKIIMSSTLTLRNASISLEALALGATDYLAKPTAKFGGEVDIFYREMIEKVLTLGRYSRKTPTVGPAAPAATKPVEPVESIAPLPAATVAYKPGEKLNPAGISALAIASSTGGPQALTSLFTQLQGHLLDIPIFITQHMPPTFTTLLAEQLGKTGQRTCIEGKEGDVVKPGCAYMAPGDFHMVAGKSMDGSVVIHINQNPPENYCRPAADPMLRSLSEIYGDKLAVVVLTGMGQDGMEGAKFAAQRGAGVIAQDEASCVVYGMPKAIVDHNLAKVVLPLGDIGNFLIQQIERK